MSKMKPQTIESYIANAPQQGQAHLRQLHALLKAVAPDAQETIKWNTPFFVQPKFLFAFSAHKHHLGFTPSPEGLAPFSKELERYGTTKGTLKVRYDAPLPEALIRKIALHRVKTVGERDDDGFW